MKFKDVKSITLKNIDLSNISVSDEYKKLQEERNEFDKAIFESLCNRSPENYKHAIEELLDEFQAALGYLQKTLGITAQEVMNHYYLHEDKLKFRPR